MTASELDDLMMAHFAVVQDLEPVYHFKPLQDVRGA